MDTSCNRLIILTSPKVLGFLICFPPGGVLIFPAIVFKAALFVNLLFVREYEMSPNPAVTICDNFSRPPADVVKQFEVPTGYITDVQGRRGALDSGIKPLFDFPAIAGPALTVKTVPDDNLAVYAALGVARAGDVLVIAVDNWTGACVIGDMVAAMFNNIGIAGVATDGAARDVSGIIQVGLPVFARAVTANSPQKNGPGIVGAEISIGGTIVRSGDIIVGDRVGIAVLPREKIPEALEGMQAVRARERDMEDRIAAGMTLPDWVKALLAGDRVRYIK
jgi:4-hydroxy-4-methyl-2-oxoglutarate aldolase